MDRNNNTMLTSPNLSYTSRDFSSIYNELLQSIPLLTKSWNPKDENDPGIVLLKLISMVGDMLSYNQDKQALEAFPRTVLQRANAQQIFRLIGYKMHWWRSATVEASFTNANSFGVNIGRYNTFAVSDGSIVYTNLKEINIPAGSTGIETYKTKLLQGAPITPLMNKSIKPTDYNGSWHDCYDYNVLASNVINNKLYLNYNNIDETSITLIDNDETPFANNEWTLVENINISDTMDKVFEFDISEDGTPFIILPDYWSTKYVITKFKLFFVLSDGPNGEIEENTLNKINSGKCYVNQDNVSISSVLEQVSIFNTASTYGYNPETCVEARAESEKFQNTINTLVTLKDYENVVKRFNSIANVYATDNQIDPHASEMKNNEINLYIVRKNDYNNSGSDYIYDTSSSNDDEIFKENILGELKSYKLMPIDINVKLENNIDWIDWTVSGQIFLRNPINNDENNNLMVKINQNLKNRFNTQELSFNESINYMDVIECIMKTDKNIWHVELDTSGIEYSKIKRSLKGNPIGKYMKIKYMIYDSDDNYTGYYATSLGCTQINFNYSSPIDSKSDEYLYTEDNDTLITENNIELVLESSDISETTINNDIITYNINDYENNYENKIVREDGYKYVIGIDFGSKNEPREYEIYNKHIIDISGYEPINTGREIDTSDPDNIKILKYNSSGEKEETGYIIKCDFRMYLSDGSDAHRYFKINKRKIFGEDTEPINVYDIYERIGDSYGEDDTWTGESINISTGEIFILRGSHWYNSNNVYDEESGQFLDNHGPVQYEDNLFLTREKACKEDVTCEYLQYIDVNKYFEDHPEYKDDLKFEFYLGQDEVGNPLTDSIGNIIKAYPIKPYSLFIYVNSDEDIIADNGSGKLNSTPGLLNGWGDIDYETGLISFKLNVLPNDFKILYKVNKITYANYTNFDTSKLFVNPKYIRNENRK